MIEGAGIRFEPSEGEKGISEFLAMMAALVRTAGIRGIVDRVAGGLSRDAKESGRSALVEVYNFLAARFEFKRDPFKTDQVTAPDTLLTRIAATGRTSGDCDDVATLGAALVCALGYEPVFIVVGKPGNLDRATGKVKLTHVFYGARVRGQVIPFDPQERIPPGQWHPPQTIGRVEIYEIFPKPKGLGRGTRS